MSARNKFLIVLGVVFAIVAAYLVSLTLVRGKSAAIVRADE